MNLADTLDQVPLKALEAAIARRKRDLHFSQVALETYHKTIEETAKAHQITTQQLLANRRTPGHAKARRALYLRLRDQHGLSAYQISILTGHDRTRIYHGLNKHAPTS